MIKLGDLFHASDWSLYTPNGELIDSYFMRKNRNMLVDKIDIYTKVEIDGYHVKGLKVYLCDSIYEDTDSIVTP